MCIKDNCHIIDEHIIQLPGGVHSPRVVASAGGPPPLRPGVAVADRQPPPLARSSSSSSSGNAAAAAAAAYRPRRSQPVDPPPECPTPAGGGGGGDPPMVFVAVKGCVCMHYTSTRLNDLYTQLPQKNINIEMYYVEVFWGSTHVLSLASLTPHLPDV